MLRLDDNDLQSIYFCDGYIDDKGNDRLYKTANNVECLLSFIAVEVKKDVIKKTLVFLRDNKSLPYPAGQYIAYLRDVLARKKLNFTYDDLREKIELLASNQEYNPIMDYLEMCHRQWDRKLGRIRGLFDRLHLKQGQNVELCFTLFRKWLIQFVKLSYGDEGTAVNTAGVLVLEGNQGIGKTRFINMLLNEDMRDYILTGQYIDVSNKDTIINVLSYALVELGEIGGTMKELDKLKAFITQDFDVMRKPYGRASERWRRRTAFISTVNGQDGFLRDNAGERRWWVISCDSIDLSPFDINQMWGEVVEAVKVGQEVHYLSSKEIATLNLANNVYKKKSATYLGLIDCMLWDSDTKTWQWLTSTEIANMLDRFGVKTASNLVGKELSRIMVDDNRLEQRQGGRYGRAWLVPQFKNHIEGIGTLNLYKQLSEGA